MSVSYVTCFCLVFVFDIPIKAINSLDLCHMVLYEYDKTDESQGMIVSIHCLAYKVQFMVSGGNRAFGEDSESQS